MIGLLWTYGKRLNAVSHTSGHFNNNAREGRERDMSYRMSDAEYWAMTLDEQREYDSGCCTSCGEHKPGDVEPRYSFGYYAGRLCSPCCRGYRDNCGIGGEQGDPGDLVECGEVLEED